MPDTEPMNLHAYLIKNPLTHKWEGWSLERLRNLLWVKQLGSDGGRKSEPSPYETDWASEMDGNAVQLLLFLFSESFLR